MRKLHLIIIAFLILGVLTACASPEPEIQTVVEQVEVTRVVTETVVEGGEAVEVTRVVVETETIEVEVTAVSATQLTGTAVTTVQRADFDLVIPEVEGVADVDEAVILEIDFTALVVE